jgi:hypothetical protein
VAERSASGDSGVGRSRILRTLVSPRVFPIAMREPSR